MATIDEIKQQAAAVKNATQVGENTAERVGGALAGLADIAKEQEDKIGKKADKETVNAALGKKADKEEMNRLLATKANTTDVDTKFTEEKKRVDAELDKKANAADVASKFTAEAARVNAELAKKFNKEDIAQEFGDSKDKVVSQSALPFRYIQNEEFIFAMVDAEEHFLAGIHWDGTPQTAKMEENAEREFAAVNKQVETIKTDLKRNVLSISFDRSTGQVIGTTSDRSRITGCVQDRKTGRIIMDHELD